MKIKPILTCCAVLAIAAFSIFVCFHQRQLLARAGQQTRNHARIIANSIWTFDKIVPTTYLTLALEANGYQSVTILDDMGGVFLALQAPEPDNTEAFLRAIRLIPIYSLESEISYEEHTLGRIIAVWPCRAIYLYFYILFCILLALTGLGLFLKVLDSKRSLESRVRERTLELEKEILERERAEGELRSFAQRLSLHVLNTPLAVIEWNLDFQVIEWNKAAEKIFEYSRAEALGRSAWELVVPEEEREPVEQVWVQLLAQTGGTRSVNTNRTKSGVIRVCEWYNTTLTDPGGKVIGAASQVLDITKRTQAEKQKSDLEAQLMQAQKMEAVGNLAGGIAHDFNNLLQSISGYAQLMLMDVALRPEHRNRLLGIEKAAKNASNLVRQLLTFSRKIESNLRPLSLNREIEQMKDILERTIPKMIAIDLHLARDLQDIHGDPIQIEQIVLNLAINAMHAMPDGGTLRIETANLILDKAFCRNHLGAKEGPSVLLSVSDTGTGMDQETLARIYEPFFTTKELGHGTGLGLSIVYGIAKNHDAVIECHSMVGTGTCFRLFFPAIPAAAVSHDREAAPEALPSGTETLLLIDDEEAILEIGTDMLTRFGYKILTAISGEEGLARFADHRDEIRLIVLDLNMPGMGGFKCMQALKKIDPRVPVLIASGFTPATILQQTRDAGARGFIPKPFKLSDLLTKIRLALDEK